MRFSTCLFFLFISSTSSAFRPKIDSVYETIDEIKVHLNKSNYQEYGLYMDGVLITEAKAKAGDISFSLSPEFKTGVSYNCMYVKNYKNKLIKFHRKSRHGFRTSIGKKYVELKDYLASNEEEIKKLQSEIPLLEQKYNKSKRSLSYNRAFNNHSCNLPSKRNYPSKPLYLKCESESDCRNDAEQLCILKVGGAVGCSEIAQDEGYSSAQVSALCSLAFAEMLEQKYSLEEALFDTTLGLVDDLADEGLNSDSLLANLFGAVLKVGTVSTKYSQYTSCKRSYTRKFFQPYKEWQESIWKIDSEPKQIYNECKNRKSMAESLVNSIYKKKKYLKELIVIKSNVKKSLEKIKDRKVEITPTCN